MFGHSFSRALFGAGLAAGLLAWAARVAVAEPAIFCITCKNPDQTYRCQVIADFRSRDALRLYCVIRTAREGNHASCSVERNVAVCNGVAKVYSYDGPAMPDMASDPQLTLLPHQPEQGQVATQKDRSPKTMVELGGRAVDASRARWRRTFGGSAESAPVPLTPAEPLPASTESINASAESAPGPMRRAAQSTGAAVGGFTRKSYRCVLSLFRDCRGEAAEGQAR